MRKSQITAARIVDLLAAKHAADVFVAECKDGSTWKGTHRRLDAWALKRSWSPFTALGYEVKVSRSDFKQDQKWVEYLPLCHYFSFVCPAGLIRAHDLPRGVGLIWVSASERLHTKVKAERHEIEPARLVDLMGYVLMSRARVVAGMNEANGSVEPAPVGVERLRRMREEVERAEERKRLAWFVGEHVKARVAEAEDQAREAKRLHGQAMEIVGHLRERGVDWDPEGNRYGTWEVRRRIDDVLGCVDDAGLCRDLLALERRVKQAREQIEGLREQARGAA